MSIIFVRIRLFILLSYLKLKGKVISWWKGLWFNRNKLNDPDSSIDKVTEISAIEQNEYDSLFLVKSTTPQIYMPRATLLQILRALPDNYVFPNPDTTELLKNELEKFNIAKIDHKIIDQIKNHLPQNYSLLDPNVSISNSNNPFVVLSSNNKVNHEVHGQILNNLPTDYKFN